MLRYVASELSEEQGNLEEIWEKLGNCSEKGTFQGISQELWSNLPLSPAFSRVEMKGEACFCGSYEGKAVLMRLSLSGEVTIRCANVPLRQSLFVLLAHILS